MEEEAVMVAEETDGHRFFGALIPVYRWLARLF